MRQLKLALILFIGGFGITPFVCTHCMGNVKLYVIVSIFSSLIWISLWLGNSNLAHFIDRYVSWTAVPGYRFLLGLVTTILFTAGTLFGLTHIFNFLTGFDIDINRETWYFTFIVTFAISAFMHGRTFLENWKKAALDAETVRREHAMAQYEALRNQVNPHFLFNSLNVLTHLVYENPDRAVKFIKQLSEVYRYVLDTREREVVPLKEELEFVASYLFLQQIRYGENLKVDITLQEKEGFVPPLAIQLLLENAIKHNVISKEEPLSIRIHMVDQYMVVENTIRRKPTLPEESGGLGLDNIKRRYSFLTDRPVDIKDGNGIFTVRIPVIQSPS